MKTAVVAKPIDAQAAQVVVRIAGRALRTAECVNRGRPRLCGGFVRAVGAGGRVGSAWYPDNQFRIKSLELDFWYHFD